MNNSFLSLVVAFVVILLVDFFVVFFCCVSYLEALYYFECLFSSYGSLTPSSMDFTKVAFSLDNYASQSISLLDSCFNASTLKVFDMIMGGSREGSKSGLKVWIGDYNDPLNKSVYLSAFQEDLLQAETPGELLKEGVHRKFLSGRCFYPEASRPIGQEPAFLAEELRINNVFIPELLLGCREYESAQIVLQFCGKPRLETLILDKYYCMVKEHLEGAAGLLLSPPSCEAAGFNWRNTPQSLAGDLFVNNCKAFNETAVKEIQDHV